VYGNSFSLVLISLAAVLVTWQLRQRRKTELALRVLNRSLDRQVQERTVALTTANADLQRENAARQQAEASLKSSLEELARSNSELEHFAHVASHDLQEPLRKILVFGDRLKVKGAKELGDQGKDYVERMQSAAHRMQALIDALLTFSRVTTQPRPFAPVDLTAVARTIASDLEVSIQRVNGRVQIGELPTIEADAMQIGQVLQNLIANALKFHRPGVAPFIEISAEGVHGQSCDGAPAPPMCHISVSDNGIGFEEQYSEKIFQPFQRLFSRDEYEGTGMGLAICKKIIERHHGSIAVRSTPGQGTTFVLTLPVRQPEKGGTAGRREGK
jgi:light-regulated signal transduction histidine kinase (bacteriophytochrome)